jgi:hypothetical protein
MVVDRVKSSLAVEQAIETHADEMATALSTLLTPALEPDEQLPDLARALRLSGRNLGEKRRLMVAAAEAHVAELNDDQAARDRRDQAATALRDAAARLRRTAEGAYGPQAATNLLAFEAGSRDPRALEIQVDRVLARLSSPDLELPTALAGVAVDVAEWAATITPLLTELKAALAEVGREVREAESTLQAKKAAIAEFDVTFGRTARLAESLFTNAGLVDIAAKVRPAARRPGPADEAPDEPPVAPPASGSGDPGSAGGPATA